MQVTLEGLSSTLVAQQEALQARAAELQAREDALGPREDAATAAEAILSEQAAQMEAAKASLLPHGMRCTLYASAAYIMHTAFALTRCSATPSLRQHL